jgi:serine/threonine-protein kinase
METENPYAAPHAEVTEPILAPIKVPEEILKKIKQAWIASIFSATITLIAILISMAGTQILGYTALELVDVALIAGLGFGIYKKSRTCAVIMLIYFVSSKILIMIETGQPAGLVVGLLFAFFYWQGVSGTFSYHKFMERQTARNMSRG